MAEVDPFDIDEGHVSKSEDLDRSRPYGQCMGHDRQRYFQDGRYFDNRGKLLPEEAA